MSEMHKEHRHKVGPTVQSLFMLVSIVFIDQLIKRVPVYDSQNLGEKRIFFPWHGMLVLFIPNIGNTMSHFIIVLDRCDGKISNNAGYKHIISNHWTEELDDFFDTKEQMLERMFIAIKDRNYVSKEITNNGINYDYMVETASGEMKRFRVAVGTNGYIVTFFEKPLP